MTKFEKMRIALRYYYIGRRFDIASDALEYAPKYHQGTRKDGVTPEFFHQLQICSFIRTLEGGLLFPELTQVAGLLHDTPEDNPDTVKHQYLTTRFGSEAGDAIWLLDKNGKDLATYHDQCASNPISSIVKGVDGISNFGSMTEVYTKEKQLVKIELLETKFLPMIKSARRNFPKQEAVYENIKFQLEMQSKLLRVINK